MRDIAAVDPSAFVESAEQSTLRSTLRSFFAAQPSPAGRVSGDISNDLWANLGQQLGALSICLPHSVGGDAQDLYTQSIVFEAVGAALAPVPALGCLGLAVPVLTAALGVPGADVTLAEIAAGKTVATLAAPTHHARFDVGRVEVVATARDRGWVLDGAVDHVIDGVTADVLVVPALAGDRVQVFMVRAATKGVSRTALSTMDLTRDRARLVFSGAPAQRIIDVDAGPILDGAVRTAQVLLAAEQVGGATAVLHATLAYVGQRFQFGRPIASFQVVKHRLADMYIQMEQARSAALFAAWANDTGQGADIAASIAQITCSQAYRRLTAAALQLHGGIGFTWEHDLHWYIKRAVSDLALLGSPAAHRRYLATALLGTPESRWPSGAVSGRYARSSYGL
jgi:alkylation response protein AidB-like acyl-CoA dehydrogenase